MRRAVLFNIAATVHTVSTAKTLGVASLTWETDCSVLLPGCCLELQLCAVCLVLKAWGQTQQLLLIPSERHRSHAGGFGSVWTVLSLLQHQFVKMQLHDLLSSDLQTEPRASLALDQTLLWLHGSCDGAADPSSIVFLLLASSVAQRAQNIVPLICYLVILGLSSRSCWGNSSACIPVYQRLLPSVPAHAQSLQHPQLWDMWTDTAPPSGTMALSSLLRTACHVGQFLKSFGSQNWVKSGLSWTLSPPWDILTEKCMPWNDLKRTVGREESRKKHRLWAAALSRDLSPCKECSLGSSVTSFFLQGNESQLTVMAGWKSAALPQG